MVLVQNSGIKTLHAQPGQAREPARRIDPTRSTLYHTWALGAMNAWAVFFRRSFAYPFYRARKA